MYSEQEIKNKYYKYLYRCEKNNLEFELLYDEFSYLLLQPCKYCSSTKIITIDRIDNEIGYTYNNCQSLCNVCNGMKSHHTEDLFFNHIIKIYENIHNRSAKIKKTKKDQRNSS